MRFVSAVVLSFSLLAAAPPASYAQERGPAAQGPRFYAASSSGAALAPVDASRVPALKRRVSLAVTKTPLGDVLETLSRRTGVAIRYSASLIPAKSPVTIDARNLTMAAILTEILIDAGVDVVLMPNGDVTVVKRIEAARRIAGAVVGRVTDAKTGDPLSGAEVWLDGTRWRTQTDAEGRYRLTEVVVGVYTLVARRIGFTKRTQPVAVELEQEVTVNVGLQPSVTQLDEIVTTVTGEQRRVELGHVVGVIKADSLVKEAPISTLSELLNGRIPGLQVFQSQGTVGGDVHLQIRGANSLLLNTEPIVIVDGVRYTSLAGDRYTFGPASTERTSPLNDINPNDVESVEVVKGPSAATLYGTDAANGVLVITTKRGRGGPARWNAYAKGTRTNIPTGAFPDLYWGWNQQHPNTSCVLWEVASGGCAQDSVSVVRNPLNDPALSMFGAKPTWEYGANVAGGRQELNYYFSGGYEDATGPVQMPDELAEQLVRERGLRELPKEWRNPNALTKLTLRGNVAAVMGDRTDLRATTGYVHSTTRAMSLTSPYTRGVFQGMPQSPYGDGAFNPAQAFVQTSNEKNDRFFASGSGQWRPMSWIATRAMVGLDLTNNDLYGLSRRGDAPDAYAEGAVSDNRQRQSATTAEIGATASYRHGRVSTRTSVGAQYVRSLNDALGTAGINLPPGGTSVGEAATVFSLQSYAETVTLGSYLEEAIGLNDRLFLTGALRVDGASAFGQNYNAVVYPKVSLSWLVSQEPFVPRIPGLDELRLRYAYGSSGQQPTAAMARPRFYATRNVENGAIVNAIRRIEQGNPDLRPERVREHEFGFDATGLAGRVQLGLTWYRRRTIGQIVGVVLPPGLGSMNTNLGLTSQRGFEAELTVHLLDRRVVSWDIILQHGLHRTILLDLGDGFATKYPEGGYVEGYPLGARFQQTFDGYSDLNGDGIIDWGDIRIGDYFTPGYFGESTAPFSQTATTAIGLFDRRLRISALVERRAGFTQINNIGQRQCIQGVCRALVDPTTPLAEQARAMYEIGIASGIAERGDFTRLRELTVAVDLPTPIVRALRVRSASLALSARNLALWTDFSGPDPESAAVGGIAARGGVAAGIPQGRGWTLRLDLGL